MDQSDVLSELSTVGMGKFFQMDGLRPKNAQKAGAIHQ